MAETSDHDTLLLLRNDVIHLTATIELFRGDFRESVARQATQFKEHDTQFQAQDKRIDEVEESVQRLSAKTKIRWSIVKWALGIVTVVGGSMAAAVGKWALGI